MSKKIFTDKMRKKTKEVNLNFYNVYFVLLFTIPIMFACITMLEDKSLIIHAAFIIAVPLILTIVFPIKTIVNNFKVRKYGEIVRAKVIGYLDDNYYIKDKPAKVIQLLIKDKEENKEIYYQSNFNSEKYKIDSEIELFIYKDMYLIKDEKLNKKERIMGIIAFILLSLLTLYFFVIIFVYYILNSSFYEMKMKLIQETNKGIMTNFKGLEYKIPDDYTLSVYEKDYSYIFESRNDNHYCTIAIYTHYSNPSYKNINTCQYYDINNHYVDDEEIIINGTKWCYYSDKNYNSHERYYLNNGEIYYSIESYKYDDRDEKCTTDFQRFMKTVKFK